MWTTSWPTPELMEILAKSFVFILKSSHYPNGCFDFFEAWLELATLAAV
jgi:hypothetical protein